MGFHASARLRFLTAAFLVAVGAGCGGGSGGGGATEAPAPPPGPLNFGSHPSAAVVLGQLNFESRASGDTLDRFSFPTTSAVTADGRLIVNDSRHNVLKTFSGYDLTATGRAADFEINGRGPAMSAAGARVAMGIGVNVFVFDSWPTKPGVLTPAVRSSGEFGCGAEGNSDIAAVHITPLGRLLVADRINNRVLIWNSIPTDSELLGPAHIVLGQQDMDSCDPNGGQPGTPGATSGQVLSAPAGVWSDDTRVVVSDSGNNRVLIWHSFPTSFQAADRVIGQANAGDSSSNRGGDPSAETLSSPQAVDVNEHGQLAVVDRDNNRVLIWNSIPQRDGAPAEQVIGQPAFDQSVTGELSAKSLFSPSHAQFHKRNLIVSEPENNRVLVWRSRD